MQEEQEEQGGLPSKWLRAGIPSQRSVTGPKSGFSTFMKKTALRFKFNCIQGAWSSCHDRVAAAAAALLSHAVPAPLLQTSKARNEGNAVSCVAFACSYIVEQRSSHVTSCKNPIQSTTLQACP